MSKLFKPPPDFKTPCLVDPSFECTCGLITIAKGYINELIKRGKINDEAQLRNELALGNKLDRNLLISEKFPNTCPHANIGIIEIKRRV